VPGSGQESFAVLEKNTDSGAGSLRQAIINANTTTGVADTINFDLGSAATITLTSAQLPTITDGAGLTIDGGSADITISGANQYRVFEVGSDAKLTVSNLTVANGADATASGSGGGIYNNGTLEVRNSTFSGNSAPNGFGGAIFSDVSDSGSVAGPLEVRNSTLSGNSVGNGGGGIANFYGTATVSNSTLSGNSANDFGGGGILISEGTATVSNSTLWDNSATASGYDGGGGIYNRGGGTVTLKNTIVANSPSASGENCYGTTITNGGYNLDSDNTCGFGTNNNSLSGIDPMLGDLADNGGPTMTHALLEGSPAIDKGNSFGESTDQRGEERPSDFDTVANATDGDGSDIGAFEVQASAPPPDKTAPYVESTSPDNGQNEVSRTTTVTATFSEEVQQDTLTTANVQLFSGNSKKPVKATLSPTSTSVTLTPSSKLDANTTYRAVVGTGVKDLADNALDQDQDPNNGNQPKQWTFTTGPK
jgi:predicted outer membrane repeat protein